VITSNSACFITSLPYRVGSAAFIGFNNASFKNNNVPSRVALYKNKQLNYMRQAANRLAASDIRTAFGYNRFDCIRVN